ncbi:epididymal-specific lipocalin-8 [Acinonyx jubatus]|uniref:Epididymal-specific lipocalin-8 n=1 Tax=Acinonyx jubatus TaxID=32536 RepID=A0ABM3Q1J6_ACIJB|nr:epididymal-specific lipocalin-8 [Acinonyx jubatus]
MDAGLLSVILGTVLVRVETATQDLNLHRIVGFWREVGVASSQNLALKTPKRLEALFLTLSGDELTVKAAYDSSGSCETENIVGSETDVSGRFVFPAKNRCPVVTAQTGPSFKGWVPPAPCLVLLEGLVLGGDRMESDPAQPGARGLSSPHPPGHRETHVIDTDYEQDAIRRVSLHWQVQDFHVLKYFTRSLEDEYGPGFWRFWELTADVGLYLVARHGRCAKLLKEVSLAPCCAEPPG